MFIFISRETGSVSDSCLSGCCATACWICLSSFKRFCSHASFAAVKPAFFRAPQPCQLHRAYSSKERYFAQPFRCDLLFLGREVVRFAVYRLELTTVNGNHHIGEHLHLPTQINESPASIFDAITIVLSEVSNGFKIRC